MRLIVRNVPNIAYMLNSSRANKVTARVNNISQLSKVKLNKRPLPMALSVYGMDEKILHCDFLSLFGTTLQWQRKSRAVRFTMCDLGVFYSFSYRNYLVNLHKVFLNESKWEFCCELGEEMKWQGGRRMLANCKFFEVNQCCG